MAEQILIVEDEADIAQTLEATDAAFAALAARRGATAA